VREGGGRMRECVRERGEGGCESERGGGVCERGGREDERVCQREDEGV
jgi:hypothetical protein